MDDLRAELELLKQRLRARQQREASDEFIEEPLPGEVVETATGRHWEAFSHWESHRRHGSFEISDLRSIPPGLLASIEPDAAPSCDPTRWAFLDTETTGLAGGSGTVAFLVGVGRITERGFTVKQYFMRDFEEEPSVLRTLADDLADAEVLVTYNGRAYDEPLLATRYAMSRLRPPFGRMTHVDLLYSARRLWKLRFESCRLVELESQILGIERQGDVPGSLIPHLYFEFLRSKRADRLVPVFRHNVFDIVTLACLTAIVPRTFSPDGHEELAHAAEMVGVGRWLHREGRVDEALALFERAIARHEWDRVPLARRIDALVALAKHYEHKRRDISKAIEHAEHAHAISRQPDLEKRVRRLRAKLDQKRLVE